VAEFLLNAVNAMKEIAAVHAQAAAAESPFGAEKEMKAEKFVLGFVQHAAANQAKIRHKLFPFPRICPPAVKTAAELQRNGAGMRPIFNAIPKSIETGPKNGPESAIAGRLFSSPGRQDSQTFAVNAGSFGKPDRARLIPSHF
jgi:hypothetical protein